MDRVQVSAVLHDDQAEDSPTIIELSNALEGVGESDPHEWIRDVLVAALEQL